MEDRRFRLALFGDYVLLAPIATGGMAEVFLARKRGIEGFRKKIALKRILPHLNHVSEFVKMFIDEARIAASLSHSNVVQIYELGKQDSSYFMTMEFVEGKSAASLIRRCDELDCDIPIVCAAFILIQVCRGLYYAHNKSDDRGIPLRIIHRDLSPQNILISYAGEVKIADFGIVKAANRLSETSTGVLKGKYSYMSPEQARGDPIDHRSDLFSCGVLMTEILLGERIFERDNEMSVLREVQKAAHVPKLMARLRQQRNIDPELEAIIRRALSGDKNKRYDSALAIQEDLTRYLYETSSHFTDTQLSALMKRVFKQEIERERHILHKCDRLLAESPEFNQPSKKRSRLTRPSRPRPTQQDEKERGKRSPRAIVVIGLTIALILFLLGVLVLWLRQ